MMHCGSRWGPSIPLFCLRVPIQDECDVTVSSTSIPAGSAMKFRLRLSAQIRQQRVDVYSFAEARSGTELQAWIGLWPRTDTRNPPARDPASAYWTIVNNEGA